jgi:competence protein ComEC
VRFVKSTLILVPAFFFFRIAVSSAQEQVYVVNDAAAPCVKLRSQPNQSAAELDCLAPGTRTTLLEVVPFWRKIRLDDGREGWAAKKFLTPSALPAPVSPPLPIPPDAFLEVHIVDVGQGDGIWIHTFDDGIDGNGIFEGKNIVIDGGPNSADNKNEMRRYLEAKAHHDAIIDTLILTHPHDDHYPDAEGIVRHFEIRNYYDPGYPKGGTEYPAFLNEVRTANVNGQTIKVMVGKQNFEAFDWGQEIRAEVLYAYPGIPDGLGSNNTLENNASIVFRLEYGNHSFLFMGDGEGKEREGSPDQQRYVEKILLDTVPQKLKATVLKIAHHGSETSSTVPFIQAVDPKIVIVCSGRRKFQGRFLPDASTLKRYCCHNPSIRIYRTDQDDEQEGRTAATDADGDHIIIRTNGTAMPEVTALKSGQPFTVNSCVPACQ